MENEIISKNFIEQEIDKDLSKAFMIMSVHVFPGTKQLSSYGTCRNLFFLNYGLAQKYNGEFHMRFDDKSYRKKR